MSRPHNKRFSYADGKKRTGHTPASQTNKARERERETERERERERGREREKERERERQTDRDRGTKNQASK